MMTFKQILLTTIILIGFNGGFAKAQTRLDKIYVKLPAKYHWETQPVQFKRDSTERIHSWDVKDRNGKKKLGFIINSIDKTEIDTDFEGAQKKLLQQIDRGQHVELLDKSTTPDGYRFVLYKGTLSHKRKGKPNSYLMAMIETETSLHELLVADLKKNLSQKFIDTWTEILKHPIIEPSKAKAPRKTRFILATTMPGALADSAIANRLRKSFRTRIHSMYKRQLKPTDISFKKDEIALTFRGNIDQDAIQKVLAKNASIQLSPLYRGRGYKNFVKQTDSLIAAQTGTNNDLHKTPDRAYINRIPEAYKTQILPAVNQLLDGQNFSKGVTLVTGPDPGSHATFIYLINTQKVIADETMITEITRFGLSLSLQFNTRGKEQLALWTRQHSGAYLAIIADGKVQIAPKIMSKIPNGRVQITGPGSLAEMEDIYNNLELSYPIPIKVESVKTL